LDIDGLWNKLDSYDIDPDKLVPRSQLKKITRRFQNDHVELVIGPRQSGKTTLLMMLISELAKQGIPPRKIFYINLDTIDQMEQFKNPMLLVDRLDHFRERGERVYLFLDEAQRLEAPGKFLKGLYDLNKKIKVFASGSSTLELRSKIKEFLTGRKRETHLYPLSFKEIIRWENKIPAAPVDVKLDHASTGDWQQKEKLFGPYLTRIMEDMLIYGGYPAVLTASAREERIEELGCI
jgi:predicted AAA+ superfamily ATPase